MGAAQRNPSILFEAVAYVSLGLLRVSASPRERLSFRDSRNQHDPSGFVAVAFFCHIPVKLSL
jgi:hypothetical protein